MKTILGYFTGIYFVLFGILISQPAIAQRLGAGKAPLFTISNDRNAILTLFNDITQGIRQGDTSRFFRYFTKEEKLAQNPKLDLYNSIKDTLNPGTLSLLTKKRLEFFFDDFNVSFRNNSANVEATIIHPDSNSKIPVSFLLVKDSSGFWMFKSSGIFLNIISPLLVHKSVSNRNVFTQTPIIITQSTHLLIPTVFAKSADGSNKVWQFSKNDALNFLNNQLLSNPVDIDAAKINDQTLTLFALDRSWQRIVYGPSDAEWIRSYGDGSGDYYFDDPVALQVIQLNGQWIIDVADRGHSVIAEFLYDPHTQRISPLASIGTNLRAPIDVISIPYTDRLLVFDAGAGRPASLLFMKQDGTILSGILHFKDGLARLGASSIRVT